MATSSATRAAFQPSESFASRSRSAYGRPSALPTSRIAPRDLYVAELATSDACWRPYFSGTPPMSFPRVAPGKARAVAGPDGGSRVGERPGGGVFGSGPAWEGPGRGH